MRATFVAGSVRPAAPAVAEVNPIGAGDSLVAGLQADPRASSGLLA